MKIEIVYGGLLVTLSTAAEMFDFYIKMDANCDYDLCDYLESKNVDDRSRSVVYQSYPDGTMVAAVTIPKENEQIFIEWIINPMQRNKCLK